MRSADGPRCGICPAPGAELPATGGAVAQSPARTRSQRRPRGARGRRRRRRHATSVSRDYRHRDEIPAARRKSSGFAQRVRDHATVRSVPGGDRAGWRGGGLRRTGVCARVVVPIGFPNDWRPDGVECVIDDRTLSVQDLDVIDGALTGCAAGATAETGTLRTGWPGPIGSPVDHAGPRSPHLRCHARAADRLGTGSRSTRGWLLRC